jgi:hypothetical protein
MNVLNARPSALDIRRNTFSKGFIKALNSVNEAQQADAG